MNARQIRACVAETGPRERLESPVSFQNDRPFAAITLLQPRASVLASAFPRTSAQPRAPRFLVARERDYLGWWESLRELCRPTHLHPYTSPIRLFRHTPVVRFRFAGRPLTVSVLLHVAVFVLLPYLPSGSFAKPMPVDVASAEAGKIYYRLTIMDLSRKLPRVTSEGSAGRPISASEAAVALPALGSTAAHPKITIILRPPRPNNPKQTIYQSASAPDLRITMDLKLPNVLVGTTAVPRPQIHFDPNSPRPVQVKKSVAAEPAPALTTSASPSVVPVSELTSTHPNLPVPPSAPVEMTQTQNALPSADGASLSGKEESALVIVGADPSQAMASLLALPPGNRWAELSISPVGGGAGSPGGVPGRARISGSASTGSEGDASASARRGESGRGAGNTGGAGILSITGGVGENSGALDPMLPANMVYAISASVLPRKNALVVSAGPMGGGGLGVYGALNCGKIYTVFLQMPGKSWTLQFCQAKHEAPTNAASLGRSAVVRIEEGLLPPDPELRFDFRRLPLPPENAHKLILLKGLIREDGTVDLVQVYRSLLPPMDEAARLALSRWKFKPATRGGQPVSVEILVGIPSDATVIRAVH